MDWVKPQEGCQSSGSHAARLLFAVGIFAASIVMESFTHARHSTIVPFLGATVLRESFLLSWSGWWWMYGASYSVYFVPLALRRLQHNGLLRRTYFGFTLQLLLSTITYANFHWLPNRRAWWESSYAAGEWDFLDSHDQRPRYYTIAGLVQDRFPQGAAVLDVGCGHAILYPLLEKSVSSYTGIDFADAAISTCRVRFAGESRCVFHTVAFEEYTPEKGFDAVILNEILYYLPLASIESVFARTLTLLKDDQSIVVISLCRNHKAWLVGHKLSRLATPEQCIRVSNVRTGSYWTVSVYRRAAELSGTVCAGRQNGE